MFRIVTIAAILALGVQSAQAGPSTKVDASAQTVPADRGLSVAVRFGDLDLNQPADARVLMKRLRQAAKTVCPPGDIVHNSYCVDRASRDAFNGALARQAAVAGVSESVGSHGVPLTRIRY